MRIRRRSNGPPASVPSSPSPCTSASTERSPRANGGEAPDVPTRGAEPQGRARGLTDPPADAGLGVHDHHRALRGRPLRDREVLRGPRLLRRRQPPAGTPAEDGGTYGPSRRAGQGRDRGRRSRGRVLRRAVEGPRRAAGPRDRVPDPVPRCDRRGPREALRGHPTATPARAGRPRGRGHPQGAPDDGESPRRGRPHHRHVDPHAPRAQGADPGVVRRRAAGVEPPGLAHLLRLQVRHPTGCRPRDRRPVPPEPALGGRPAAPRRGPTSGSAPTCGASRPTASSCGG